MLRVGLNQNQTSYQNKKGNLAFGASLPKVRRVVTEAMQYGDFYVTPKYRAYYAVKTLALKDIKAGNYQGALDTRKHLRDLSIKELEKGNQTSAGFYAYMSDSVFNFVSRQAGLEESRVAEGVKGASKKGVEKFKQYINDY